MRTYWAARPPNVSLLLNEFACDTVGTRSVAAHFSELNTEGAPRLRKGVAPCRQSCGHYLIFLVRASRHDLQRVIRQRALQRLRLVPRRAHPESYSFGVFRITGIAFGWIGSTSLGLYQSALDAISAHIKDLCDPNRKYFAINRAFVAAENGKISSES